MKKVKEFDRKKTVKKISVVLVCILFFGMGMASTYIMNGETHSSEWKKLESIYSILTNQWFYADQVDEDTLVEQAIEGMTTLEEDAHTNYFDLEQAEKFSSSLEGSSIGVGFSYYVNEDNNFVVIKTFVNSSAEEAGLQKGDIITAVGDMKCSENEAEDIVSMIKSSEAKELKVQYIRNGKSKTTTVTPSTYDTTVSFTLEDDYGVIQLNSFSEYSAKEFNECMQRMKEAGISKLILDLRGNTGGYLTSVLDISSCLLPEDSVVFIENKADGSSIEQKVSGEYDQVKMDSIVILQNGNTASASEVLIGALKDNLGKTVQTVGETTYGKGTEQVSTAFTDGTSIKYTVAEWTTPNNTSINKVGFEPDIEVAEIEASSVKYTDMEEDEVIEADSVHTNAAALQTFLDFLGYNVDRKDEYFSPTSSQSLAQFQSDYGLESTGNCDYTTWNKIKDVVRSELNENNDAYDYQMQKAVELIQ